MRTASNRASQRTALLALGLACVAGACAHVSEGMALMDAGDGVIHRIDGEWIPKGETGAFEIKPGEHAFEVTAEARQAGLLEATIFRSGLRTVCVKARAGHRYKVKKTLKDDTLLVYVVDQATGAPLKTPCGPDEDED